MKRKQIPSSTNNRVAAVSSELTRSAFNGKAVSQHVQLTESHVVNVRLKTEIAPSTVAKPTDD